MSSLNVCQFIGNLGRDPEIRDMGNGKRVANLTLACGESWKDRDGNKKGSVEWVKVTVFNDGLIGVVEKWCKKGDKLYVSGKMQTRKYTDKDGVERYATEIVLGQYDAKLLMLGGGVRETTGVSAHDAAKGNGYAPNDGYVAESAVVSDVDDDTIPF